MDIIIFLRVGGGSKAGLGQTKVENRIYIPEFDPYQWKGQSREYTSQKQKND